MIAARQGTELVCDFLDGHVWLLKDLSAAGGVNFELRQQVEAEIRRRYRETGQRSKPRLRMRRVGENVENEA